MSIDNTRSQFELFPSSSKPSTKSEKRKRFWPGLILTLDNVVVLVIVIMMSMVVSFSIGVEKGKRFAKPRPQAAEEMRPEVITAVESVPVPEEASAPVEPDPVDSLPVEVVMARLVDEPQAVVIEQVIEEIPVPQGAYTVQVASFKKESQARKEAESLEKKGYEIFVMPKGSYSIVCVGNFIRKDQAQKMSQKLKKRYKDCLIRRL